MKYTLCSTQGVESWGETIAGGKWKGGEGSINHYEQQTPSRFNKPCRQDNNLIATNFTAKLNG
ncbi:hypothetical protein E2C01_084487 [Portunus trituberculatus]|uniref:Uncharacterized protein n=1 Tax=Portunus trituberculatus TaxID=210409 RepID=A0A5B7J447_PORTR|nr:hypothetical protein [Portunus trituberculatus]